MDRVLGSMAGRGFQWHSGGRYAHQGLGRQGMLGCTALDFWETKFQDVSEVRHIPPHTTPTERHPECLASVMLKLT